MKRITGIVIAGLVAACGGAAPQDESPGMVTIGGSNFLVATDVSGGVTVQISTTNANPGATAPGTAVTFMANGACPGSLPGGATVCVANGYNQTTGNTLAISFNLAAGTYYYDLIAYNSGGTAVSGGTFAAVKFTVASGAPTSISLGPANTEASTVATAAFTAIGMTGGSWFAYTGASAGPGVTVTFTASAVTVPGGAAVIPTAAVTCSPSSAALAATPVPAAFTDPNNNDVCTITYAAGNVSVQVPLFIQNTLTQQPSNVIPPTITQVVFDTTLGTEPVCTLAIPGTGSCGFSYKLPTAVFTPSKGAWAKSTAYSVNDTVLNGANLYIATVAGTSAASGTGPAFTSGTGTDGTVTWRFVVQPSASSSTTWVANNAYLVGDLVNSVGNLYVATAAGTSAATTAVVGTRWAPSTAYAAGAQVTDGISVYVAAVAGTSASSGSGPTGIGTGIVDGTVTWNYVTFIAPSTYKGPGSSAYPQVNGIQDGTVIWNYVPPTFVNGAFSVHYNSNGVFNAALPPSLKVASSCDYTTKASTGSGNSTNYGSASSIDTPVLWTEPTVQQINSLSGLSSTWTTQGRTQCAFTLTLNNQGATDSIVVYAEFTQ